MTVQELYSELDGDFYGVSQRLPSEALIVKFLKKFVDSDELSVFKENLAAKNYKDAFRNIHNIKGVCLNLGLDKLGEVSSELCETLRNGEPAQDITGFIEKVEQEYARTVEIIGKL